MHAKSIRNLETTAMKKISTGTMNPVYSVVVANENVTRAIIQTLSQTITHSLHPLVGKTIRNLQQQLSKAAAEGKWIEEIQCFKPVSMHNNPPQRNQGKSVGWVFTWKAKQRFHFKQNGNGAQKPTKKLFDCFQEDLMHDGKLICYAPERTRCLDQIDYVANDTLKFYLKSSDMKPCKIL